MNLIGVCMVANRQAHRHTDVDRKMVQHAYVPTYIIHTYTE